MILGTNGLGSFAWHCAAEFGNLRTLQYIYQCAEEKLTTEEFESKLLLGAHSLARTAWHWAARNGNLKMSQQIYDCAEET